MGNRLCSVCGIELCSHTAERFDAIWQSLRLHRKTLNRMSPPWDDLEGRYARAMADPVGLELDMLEGI